MTNALLVVGSVAFDTIETRAGKRDEILGGAAVYASLAASRFARVNVVGVVGNDDFPKPHLDLLARHGVDTRGIERAEGRTFRWGGVYAGDFATRTTLFTELGVFERFDPKLPQSYLPSRCALLGNIHPSLQLKVLDAVNRDCFVAADTMNLWIDTTRADLERVIARANLLIINDEESRMLTDQPQVAVAARRILAMGPSFLIVKRGEHGAWLFNKDKTFFVPGYPLDSVVDPTGAGDSFAGALMGWLVSQPAVDARAVARGMVHATAIASHTVEAFGVEGLVDLDRRAAEARYADLRALVDLQ